jgi:hypothetical protein
MQRCADLAKRWHLAVGTATSIHLEGPGRAYVTRLNIDLALLDSPCRELSIAVVLRPATIAGRNTHPTNATRTMMAVPARRNGILWTV